MTSARSSGQHAAGDERPLVFLCHSSGDKQKVRQLYKRLTRDGVRCWFDEEDLLPGHDWELEIEHAMARSTYVVVCLSEASTTRAGYVQKELKRALDLADRQPDGSVFLIPVKLETCNVPDRLKRWHFVHLFEGAGYGRLAKSLGIEDPESGRGRHPSYPAPNADAESTSAEVSPLLPGIVFLCSSALAETGLTVFERFIARSPDYYDAAIHLYDDDYRQQMVEYEFDAVGTVIVLPRMVAPIRRGLPPLYDEGEALASLLKFYDEKLVHFIKIGIEFTSSIESVIPAKASLVEELLAEAPGIAAAPDVSKDVANAIGSFILATMASFSERRSTD